MQDFEKQGFKIIDDFLPLSITTKILDDLNSLNLGSGQGGIRNIESQAESVKDLVMSEHLRNHAEVYLKGIPNFVRAIYFNKTEKNNWLVPWHQDKTIAVSQKLDSKGWRAWSIKKGQIHVQPPLLVLNDMVTFRINLDEVTKDNGYLKVIAGSHQKGILQQNEISELVSKSEIIDCLSPQGSALIMKPLIVHSSSKALIPSNRRVLHIEYSSAKLPHGLKWSSEFS